MSNGLLLNIPEQAARRTICDLSFTFCIKASAWREDYDYGIKKTSRVTYGLGVLALNGILKRFYTTRYFKFSDISPQRQEYIFP